MYVLNIFLNLHEFSVKALVARQNLVVKRVVLFRSEKRNIIFFLRVLYKVVKEVKSEKFGLFLKDGGAKRRKNVQQNFWSRINLASKTLCVCIRFSLNIM